MWLTYQRMASLGGIGLLMCLAAVLLMFSATPGVVPREPYRPVRVAETTTSADEADVRVGFEFADVRCSAEERAKLLVSALWPSSAGIDPAAVIAKFVERALRGDPLPVGGLPEVTATRRVPWRDPRQTPFDTRESTLQEATARLPSLRSSMHCSGSPASPEFAICEYRDVLYEPSTGRFVFITDSDDDRIAAASDDGFDHEQVEHDIPGGLGFQPLISGYSHRFGRGRLPIVSRSARDVPQSVQAVLHETTYVSGWLTTYRNVHHRIMDILLPLYAVIALHQQQQQQQHEFSTTSADSTEPLLQGRHTDGCALHSAWSGPQPARAVVGFVQHEPALGAAPSQSRPVTLDRVAAPIECALSAYQPFAFDALRGPFGDGVVLLRQLVAGGLYGWLLEGNEAYQWAESRSMPVPRPFFMRARAALSLAESVLRVLQLPSKRDWTTSVAQRGGLIVVVDRRHSRRILNAVELVRQLQRLVDEEAAAGAAAAAAAVVGPVYLEDWPMQEQIALMVQARLVVAMHGAGLLHMLFMRPGSAVIEVAPLFSESLYGLTMPALAAAVHVHHHPLSLTDPRACPSLAPRAAHLWSQVWRRAASQHQHPGAPAMLDVDCVVDPGPLLALARRALRHQELHAAATWRAAMEALGAEREATEPAGSGT